MNNMKSIKKELSAKKREALLAALKGRFEKNLNRHKGNKNSVLSVASC